MKRPTWQDMLGIRFKVPGSRFDSGQDLSSFPYQGKVARLLTRSTCQFRYERDTEINSAHAARTSQVRARTLAPARRYIAT